MGRFEIVLLDTCALLWLAHSPKNLKKETLEEINKAPVVYISAISGFEIGIKHKSGKLILPTPPEQWLKAILDHHDISIIDLTMEVCVSRPPNYPRYTGTHVIGLS